MRSRPYPFWIQISLSLQCPELPTQVFIGDKLMMLLARWTESSVPNRSNRRHCATTDCHTLLIGYLSDVHYVELSSPPGAPYRFCSGCLGNNIATMHIRPAEPAQLDSGRQHESGTGRKLRLGGGASRVPVQPNKKVTETPLRALVSAIGQSLGTRTPLRNQAVGSRTPSSVKGSLFSSAGKPSFTTPGDGTRTRSKSLFSAEGRGGTFSTAAGSSSKIPSTPAGSSSKIPSTPAGSSSKIPSTPARSSSKIPSTPARSSSKIPSTPKSSRSQATAGTPSKTPATPISTRVQASAATPSRRSSLSSSSSSSSKSITSNLTKKQSISSATPTSRKLPATPTARKLDPTMTPVTKKSSFPPRTPRAENNPTTPSSKPSYIPAPTPRRPAVSSTPSGKQISTPQARSKSYFPTTPVSKPTSANPSTPSQGDKGFSTPFQHGSNQTFYTPTSTLPLTPLQPRNFNVPESSRKLHFGINVAAMADQENMGSTTPRPASAVITEATFSFDKNRLAQIKARQNASQLLKSPAQRVRAPTFHQVSKTPGRLPQVAEDRSTRFDEGVVVNTLSHSPARRRVANALF